LLYMENAGYLLLASVLLILACAAYILLVLCTRCNSHVLLYVHCCCCRIPQRASVYFAFDIVKTISWAATLFYIVLGVYGLLETNFFLTTSCPGGNTCWSYPIPHYGFACLIVVTLAISCFAFSRVQALDVKLNVKSMQLYFPENLRKAESRNCALKLDQLFRCIACIKNMCIAAFVVLVSFHNVGLLTLVFYNDTASTTTNAVMYFQFQGLTNSHGVAENTYVEYLEGLRGDASTTPSPSTNDIDAMVMDSAGFETICGWLRAWTAIILVCNLFVFLPYLWFVVLRYSAVGCCKFLMVLASFVEWLVLSILVILYYYEFYVFFHNSAELKLEFELEQATNSTFNVFWMPDWGIIVVGILWFYLLRFMYAAFKAM